MKAAAAGAFCLVFFSRSEARGNLCSVELTEKSFHLGELQCQACMMIMCVSCITSRKSAAFYFPEDILISVVALMLKRCERAEGKRGFERQTLHLVRCGTKFSPFPRPSKALDLNKVQNQQKIRLAGLKNTSAHSAQATSSAHRNAGQQKSKQNGNENRT